MAKTPSPWGKEPPIEFGKPMTPEQEERGRQGLAMRLLKEDAASRQASKKTYSPSPFGNPHEVPKVQLKIKKLPTTDEYKVQWFQNGKLDEDKSYYTNDRQDAFDTLRAMENEAIRAGFKVESYS